MLEGWNPILDVAILLLAPFGMWFGWMVRAEKADRDAKRSNEVAYLKGYMDGKRDREVSR